MKPTKQQLKNLVTSIKYAADKVNEPIEEKEILEQLTKDSQLLKGLVIMCLKFKELTK